MKSFVSKKIAVIFFSILLATFALDQISKIIVVQTIPSYPEKGSIVPLAGDFLRFTHVANKNMAFSLGSNLPPILRSILLFILPIAVLGWLIYTALFDKKLSPMLKYTLGIIIGGGFGNLVDRIFRPSGVVDFIDVKTYGLFGFERWPIFNVADIAVVVGVILFLILTFTQRGEKHAR